MYLSRRAPCIAVAIVTGAMSLFVNVQRPRSVADFASSSSMATSAPECATELTGEFGGGVQKGTKKKPAKEKGRLQGTPRRGGKRPIKRGKNAQNTKRGVAETT